MYMRTGKSLKDIQQMADSAYPGKENVLEEGIQEYHNFLAYTFEQYFTFRQWACICGRLRELKK